MKAPKVSAKRRKTAKASASSSSVGSSAPPASKKVRLSADDLRWKSIKATSFAGVDEGGGMMMLEELDDVDVQWEETAAGTKVARFMVRALFTEWLCCCILS